MRKRNYKPFWLILIALAAAASIVLPAAPLSPSSRTLASLRQVDDFPLYTLHYYDDYHFQDYLKSGRLPDFSSISRPTSTHSWSCTCFAGLNPQGEALLGRNFDWSTRSALLLFTHPSDGYASVSLVDLSALGIGDEILTEQDHNKLLMAPYVPFDGMNEKGLAVGMMALDSARAPYQSGRITLGELQVIRLVLDGAKNVDEAVRLIGSYNIEFGGGPPLHYMIADASRRSVVIEFVNGEMKVLNNSSPWQVSTNFIISEAKPSGADSPCWRYNKAYQALEKAAGYLSVEKAMGLLQDVSQDNTRWSAIYHLSDGGISLSMGKNYSTVHSFTLGKD